MITAEAGLPELQAALRMAQASQQGLRKAPPRLQVCHLPLCGLGDSSHLDVVVECSFLLPLNPPAATLPPLTPDVEQKPTEGVAFCQICLHPDPQSLEEWLAHSRC